MWERGLKLGSVFALTQHYKSLPMWERGLKLTSRKMAYQKSVAPHVGAWIETPKRVNAGEVTGVAPHVGAWIETLSKGKPKHDEWSLPMWERGLKPIMRPISRVKVRRSPCGSVD